MEFYSLARVTGKESEALALGQRLYAERKNRTPTLLVLLLVLETHENPTLNTTQRATELFETPQKAYEALCAHWLRGNDRFPVYGVAATLESLEKLLAVPPEKSIFGKPLPPPADPDNLLSQ